jgi:hypothetical protein
MIAPAIYNTRIRPMMTGGHLSAHRCPRSSNTVQSVKCVRIAIQPPRTVSLTELLGRFEGLPSAIRRRLNLDASMMDAWPHCGLSHPVASVAYCVVSHWIDRDSSHSEGQVSSSKLRLQYESSVQERWQRVQPCGLPEAPTKYVPCCWYSTW